MQRTVNPCVAGSSPARGATLKKPERDVQAFLGYLPTQHLELLFKAVDTI